MTSDGKAFWASIAETARDMEHRRNLVGKTTEKCGAPGCDRGVTRPGYTDYDGYGSIWRETEHCRVCGGRGRVEVDCTPDVEAAAVEREIADLRDRAKSLRARLKTLRLLGKETR